MKDSPNLDHDEENAGLRATWSATTGNTASGSALEKTLEVVLVFTMEFVAMTRFFQELKPGDVIAASLRLQLAEPGATPRWRVAGYKKITDHSEIKAWGQRAEQTYQMLAQKDTKRKLLLEGTPTKRQKKLDEMSDFSTPRMGCFDERSELPLAAQQN